MADWISGAEVVHRGLDRVDLELRRAPPWAVAARAAAIASILVAVVFAVVVPPQSSSRARQDAILEELHGLEALPMDAEHERRERALLLDLSALGPRAQPSWYGVVAVAVWVGGFCVVFGPALLLAWWWAGPIRITLARHWVELDGVRIELADLGAVGIADGRVAIERDGTPLRSDVLLKPPEAGYFLEAAEELLVPSAASAEADGRQRARQALDPLRARA